MSMNWGIGAWIAIGAGMGAAVGAATDNMGQWVALGVAFGIGLSKLGRGCC
jgi:hypothetical protein